MSTNRRATEIDPAPPRRTRRRSTDVPESTGRPNSVWIGSVGAWVPVSRYITDPLVAQLVGEDLSWRIALAEWQGRRPSPARLHARSAWRRDGALLTDKRRRIGTHALELGIPIGEHGGRRRRWPRSRPPKGAAL